MMQGTTILIIQKDWLGFSRSLIQMVDWWVLGTAVTFIQSSKDADHYAAAAIWLHDNIEPGTRIFQTDWDDFTRLFFYNSQVSYTASLDPTFFELENEAL